MPNHQKEKHIIKQIILGEYQLDGRHPIEHLNKDIDLLNNYFPRKEELQHDKSWCLKRLLTFRRDLELGLKKM